MRDNIEAIRCALTLGAEHRAPTDAERDILAKYAGFGVQKGTKYPLILFMADASTPDPDITLPLTQCYGGLVWATDELQKEHPCFVIVPQYPYIEVDNQLQTGKKVDMTINLIRDLCGKYPVDTYRIYTTGQSMGGMMSMYFNVKYKGFFAASLYVACEWDISK